MTTIGRILIGLDFSEPSRRAARWAARDLAPEAALRLVHVIDLPRPPTFLEGLYPPRERLLRLLRGDAERQIEEMARVLEADRPGRAVEVEIRDGRTHDELADAATGWSADLVVVGEHGQRPGIWRMLGSTAERLIRVCRVPVMVTRAATTGVPRSILVPIDESGQTESVLRWGLVLGRMHGARITVLHVLHPMLVTHVGLVSSTPKKESVQGQLERCARLWVEEMIARVGGDPDEVDVVIAYGESRYEILAALKRYEVDLVVMGSRGAGGVTRALLGSVATAVIRGSACPVLVVSDEPRT